MTTSKQKIAAKKNVKKAQEKWKSMTHRQHALAQPQGRDRKKPGYPFDYCKYCPAGFNYRKRRYWYRRSEKGSAKVNQAKNFRKD